MPNFLKPVLALIITVILFAGYIYLADAKLMNFVQTRFFNPSVVNSYVKENSIDAEITKNHITYLQEKFLSILKEPAVLGSFLYNQNETDIYERSRSFGILLESTTGLLYARFVDNNGLRIHFSTLPQDIFSRSSDSTAYRNYNEDGLSLPYETLSVPAGVNSKFIMDEQNDRIIFSFPFYDAMDIHRGTASFYVSISSIAQRLIADGRLKISDGICVVAKPPGILLGSPQISRSGILSKVSEIWNEEKQERVTLDAEDSEMTFSLISLKTDSGFFFGRLINDSQFYISEPMKLILKLSIFLTFFLTLFFLLNIKPNPEMLVKNRIKRLRDNLFEKLYINKSVQERSRWILELEQRRDEIRSELKQKLKLSRRQEAVIDDLIDKSWDELIAVLKSGSGKVTAADTAKLENAEALAEIEEAETLEEIGAAEEIEEIEEVETLEEMEEVEELEEIEEAEELEEIEETEELEEVEEIEEIGALEEIEVVSPFSTMFSALDDKNVKKTRRKKNI